MPCCSAACCRLRSLVLWYGLGRPVITSEISNWSVFVLFERSEFLIATCKKKKSDSLCVCSANLGFSVRSANRIRPKHGIPLSKYIAFLNTAVQASCGEEHSTEWRLPTWCPKRRSPLMPSRTDSSNLHVI